MTYNLPRRLAPTTRGGFAWLFISQLLSLAMGHLGPIVSAIIFLTIFRELHTNATACYATLRFLMVTYHYLLALITPLPALHALSHKLLDWGGHMGEQTVRLSQIVLWRANITF